jgi:hypothetical protein
MVYTGKTSRGSFARNSPNKYYGDVSIQTSDYVTDMFTKIVQNSVVYGSYNLCAASNSLFHSVAKLSTDITLKNYCFNSGFENPTVGNSWIVTVGTVERSSAVTLFGSYVGLVKGSGAIAQQWIAFSNEDKINVGDYFSLTCFLRGVSAGNVIVKVREWSGYQSASALAHYTQATTAVIVADWREAHLTHTVVSSSTVLLSIELAYVDCGFYVDQVSMFRTTEPIAWGFTTTKDTDTAPNSGNADVCSSASYTLVPIDADYIASTAVSYYRIDEGTRVLNFLDEIMDAGISRYCGITCDGILQFRNYMGGADYPNNGIVDDSQGVRTKMDTANINKIKVHGVVLKAGSQDMVIWEAEASELFDRLSTGGISHVINGGEYCKVGTDKDYEIINAMYGEVK